MRVDVPRVATTRDAEVGVAGLARTIDRAAHHSNFEVLLVSSQPRLDDLGELVDLDIRAATRRARDHLGTHVA